MGGIYNPREIIQRGFLFVEVIQDKYICQKDVREYLEGKYPVI